MTPTTIITAALKKCGVLGVGQSADPTDMDDAFNDLNGMLGQWAMDRWMCYHLVDSSRIATGAISYTIGPNGDFNVNRPIRLESAFLRFPPGGTQIVTGPAPELLLETGGPIITETGAPILLGTPGTTSTVSVNTSNQLDFGLRIIATREEYNRIGLKYLGLGGGGWPTHVFLDTDYPLGTMYFWPIPTAGQFEMHVAVMAQLAQLATLNDIIVLPPGYYEAIMYNLCLRIIVAYQLPENASITRLAAAGLRVVKRSNSQVANLRMPGGIPTRGNAGGYPLYIYGPYGGGGLY